MNCCCRHCCHRCNCHGNSCGCGNGCEEERRNAFRAGYRKGYNVGYSDGWNAAVRDGGPGHGCGGCGGGFRADDEYVAGADIGGEILVDVQGNDDIQQ